MTELAAVERFGLLLVRPGMLIVSTPIFGGPWAPPHVKVGAIVLVSLLLMPTVALPDAESGVGIAALAFREAMIGLALGLGLRALLAGAELAGHLAGFQLGFAYASLVDPQTGVRNNLLSLLYGLLAVFVVFATNAHHDFLRALALSYRVLPVGAGGVDGTLADVIARLLGVVFRVGLHLAAPVIVVLLIVELALGLLARAAPMLNLMAQGFPIRLLVGLLALAATLQAIPAVIHTALPAALQIGTRAAAVFR